VVLSVEQRCLTGFPERLVAFEVDQLERLEDSVYALDGYLRLAYVNQGWERFALENDGAEVLEQYPPGADVLSVCGPLRPFYESHFRHCLEHGARWAHDYECPSPERYRRFHMDVYPLPRHGGLLIVNTRSVERPFDKGERPVRDPVESEYAQPNGLIVQCSHCRRVQRADRELQWDWIPAWVHEPPANTSGGLCRPCYGLHYPPPLD
jgi:hypothetical protein